MIGLFRKKHYDRSYAHGSGQVLGERDYQVECFYAVSMGQSTFAAITGGNKDAKIDRSVAILAIETLKDMYQRLWHKKTSIEYFFAQAIKDVNKAIIDNALEQNFRPSVMISAIENGFLYVSEIHDNIYGGAVYLYRNGKLREIRNKRKISVLRISRIKLSGNEIVLIASKGFASSLVESEIISCLSDTKHPSQRCQLLRSTILQKHLKNQDNATMIAIEMMS